MISYKSKKKKNQIIYINIDSHVYLSYILIPYDLQESSLKTSSCTVNMVVTLYKYKLLV